MVFCCYIKKLDLPTKDGQSPIYRERGVRLPPSLSEAERYLRESDGNPAMSPTALLSFDSQCVNRQDWAMHDSSRGCEALTSAALILVD